MLHLCRFGRLLKDWTIRHQWKERSGKGRRREGSGHGFVRESVTQSPIVIDKFLCGHGSYSCRSLRTVLLQRGMMITIAGTGDINNFSQVFFTSGRYNRAFCFKLVTSCGRWALSHATSISTSDFHRHVPVSPRMRNARQQWDAGYHPELIMALTLKPRSLVKSKRAIWTPMKR